MEEIESPGRSYGDSDDSAGLMDGSSDHAVLGLGVVPDLYETVFDTMEARVAVLLSSDSSADDASSSVAKRLVEDWRKRFRSDIAARQERHDSAVRLAQCADGRSPPGHKVLSSGSGTAGGAGAAADRADQADQRAGTRATAGAGRARSGLRAETESVRHPGSLFGANSTEAQPLPDMAVSRSSLPSSISTDGLAVGRPAIVGRSKRQRAVAADSGAWSGAGSGSGAGPGLGSESGSAPCHPSESAHTRSPEHGASESPARVENPDADRRLPGLGGNAPYVGTHPLLMVPSTLPKRRRTGETSVVGTGMSTAAHISVGGAGRGQLGSVALGRPAPFLLKPVRASFPRPVLVAPGSAASSHLLRVAAPQHLGAVHGGGRGVGVLQVSSGGDAGGGSRDRPRSPSRPNLPLPEATQIPAPSLDASRTTPRSHGITSGGVGIGSTSGFPHAPLPPNNPPVAVSTPVACSGTTAPTHPQGTSDRASNLPPGTVRPAEAGVSSLHSTLVDSPGSSASSGHLSASDLDDVDSEVQLSDEEEGSDDADDGDFAAAVSMHRVFRKPDRWRFRLGSGCAFVAGRQITFSNCSLNLFVDGRDSRAASSFRQPFRRRRRHGASHQPHPAMHLSPHELQE